MRIADFIELHRRRIVIGGATACALALIAGAATWWWMARWKPPPSIFDTPVDGVMGYLALEDFSKLSLKERVQFMLEFADRFRGLQQGESAVLAGFLAGLSGPSRETLRQNVRLLAKDILADGATRYLALTDAAARKKFLDDWLVEWMKTGERLAVGEPDDKSAKSDAERLADVKQDGKREAERRPRNPVQMDGERARRFLDFWQSDVEQASTPKEQGQIVRFLTDLRDHIVRG